jgi:four helix bundle protein
MAFGSTNEVDYHLLLAHDLRFINDPDYDELQKDVLEVKRMLATLIRKIQSDR